MTVELIGGRPKIINDETIEKLEQAYAIGCTDEEAALFADVNVRTLYRYCQENTEFAERREMLKQKPVLKARATIDNNLHNPDVAKWLLEKKKRNEFGKVSEVIIKNEDFSKIPDVVELIKKPVGKRTIEDIENE